MMFTPIRSKQTPGAEMWQRARALRISVVLGVCGGLLATGTLAEDCWREPVNSGWQLAEFNFASWGDTYQSRVVLVDIFGQNSLDLALNWDIYSSAAVVKPDSSVN